MVGALSLSAIIGRSVVARAGLASKQTLVRPAPRARETFARPATRVMRSNISTTTVFAQGVTKEVITAPAPGAASPKKGDKVGVLGYGD
jgi:hypothetical protein